jgi:hypothetical protein
MSREHPKPVDRASTEALLDRARMHIAAAALPGLVMNDPGTAGYVAAYTRVLQDGVEALFEDADDGLPLLGTFDITENLYSSHAAAHESSTHRWFSVLTAAIALLGASDYRYAPFSETLATLLRDSFALQAAEQAGAPVDLLPSLCRELRESSYDPRERALALVGELLTARMTDVEAEAACHELHALHDSFQTWFRDDGEVNAFYAERPEFIWGAAASRSELPAWLDLVEGRFPSSPRIAGETRQKLLEAGEALLGSRRASRGD